MVKKKSNRTAAEGLQRNQYNKCGEVAITELYWCISFNKSMNLKAVEAD